MLIFWPEASHHWILQVKQGFSAKVVTSSRALIKEHALGPLALVSLSLSELQPTPASSGDLSRPVGVWSRVQWSHCFTLDPSAHESLHESFLDGGAWHRVQNFLFCRRTSWYNYFPVCKLWYDYITNLPLLPSHCGFVFVFGTTVSFLLGSRWGELKSFLSTILFSSHNYYLLK